MRESEDRAGDRAESGEAAPQLRRPTEPVRSFVALPCPPALRSTIEEARRGWRDVPAAVKWAEPAKIHLTLRFLGDASPDALSELHDRLVETAREVDPVTLVPGDTGAFPGWNRARVLWLGFDDEDGAVDRLAAAVEADARASGFAAEERPFVPHLTLGRVKGRRGARDAVEAIRSWRPGTGAEEVDAMILFESRLGPGGATHTALARYPLGGSP